MKTSITKLLVPSFLILMSAQAFASDMTRLHCPKAHEVITHSERPVEDYADFLKENNIQLKTEVSSSFLEEFIFEYEKFPQSLREELIDKRTRINLMEGNGVTVDPTWGSHNKTFDGRDWSQVPGAGGVPGSSPTRVVINNLYAKHGSVNLVLHEHAHTLDQLQGRNSVSTSKTWKGMLENNPRSKEFLGVICGAYCQDNLDEGFAEMFAYYHACGETREQMEAELPEFADFMKDLTSIKEFKKADKKFGKEVEVETESDSEQSQGKGQSVGKEIKQKASKIFRKIFG